MAANKHNKRTYRSGLEKVVAEYLKQHQKQLRYEELKIEWRDLRYRTYTPDFVLDNGIIIETKGIFERPDQKKHVWIKRQHPNTDIRFVFTNADKWYRKDVKHMTYGKWCDKMGFKYCNYRQFPRVIKEWLNE